MKKYIGICAFLLFAFSGFGQVVDTAAVVREVDSLLNLSNNLSGLNDLDSAIKITISATATASQYLGKNHLKLAECLINQARILETKRELDKALNLYLQTKSIQENILGKMNLEYSLTLIKIGSIYYDQGKFYECEKYYIEVKNIRESILGRENVEYSIILNRLGNLYAELSQQKKSERYYLEALDIRLNKLGKEHPKYLSTALNLGLLYAEMGEFEKAERLLLEVLQIQKKIGDENSNSYLNLINTLGILYGSWGDYFSSEKYFLEAVELTIKVPGIDASFKASVLHNLGLNYVYLNNFVNAEKYLLESKEIRSKVLGENHPDFATNLLNIGYLYIRIGRYAEAESSLLQAKEIQERTLGKYHPQYVNIIYGLGVAYHETYQINKSIQLLTEATELCEKVKGKNNTNYIRNITGLANVLILAGRLVEADSLLTKAIQLYSTTDGAEKFTIFGTIQIKYDLLREQGRFNECVEMINKMFEIGNDLIKESAFSLSEKEFLYYLSDFIGPLHKSFSFIQTNYTVAPFINQIGYDYTLLLKSINLSIKMSIGEVRKYHPHIDSLYQQVLNDQKYLSSAYSNSKVNSEQISELESQTNAIEKQLLQEVASFAEIRRDISWRKIQSALRPNEAALEFVHFKYYNPKPTDSILYAALLLKPGMQHPMFIPLCEEKQLKALLPATDGKLNNDQVNELYNNSALYRLIWSPLESHLTDVRKVYYSPSGLLHRLNLAALPSSLKTVLSDRHEMVSLGSTRQLALDNQHVASIEAPTALIYGGIQFDLDSTVYKERAASQTNNPRSLSFVQTDSTLRSGTWDFLKWSEKEADNIQTALGQAGIKAQVIKGRQATEESFKQIGQTSPSPRILHISTHGFFFPDPANPPSETRRLQSDAPIFKLSEHPMIRSGLILAGANHAWKTGQPLGNREDGILTAYEISQLDLRNTELVVLSACETGLGQIEGNEGVYGLQRAFKIAGAKTLVMSLWQVPDYQTQALMTVFYQNLLTKKLPVRQALQAAQKEMRDHGYEPYYWAGFVVLE